MHTPWRHLRLGQAAKDADDQIREARRSSRGSPGFILSLLRLQLRWGWANGRGHHLLLLQLRATAVGLGLETLGISLGVETLDEELECQRQFKESSGDQEDEADGDPEDLSDGSRHMKRVADHSQTRQPLGDQPGPEQQQT